MKTINPGVYTDLSNEDYHGSNGISKTGLDLFASDQSALEWAKNCPVDKDKLKTLDFGDAMHAICLEPERLESDFAVMPDINLRTNVGKEEKKQFILENKDKKIITFDERKKLKLMFESVMAHPYARKLLDADGISEQSHYWIDEESGELCKCRPDRNVFNSKLLVDVKTTETLAKFKFSIEDYRYYVQSPFYLDGYNASTGEDKDTFVFLVIQKTIELGRYPVGCVVLPSFAVEYGRQEYKQNLMHYAQAKESGNYKGIYETELSYNFTKKIGH